MSYDGLTIDFCEKVDAKFIVRGVRNTGDFEFEKAIARTNRFLLELKQFSYWPQQKHHLLVAV